MKYPQLQRAIEVINALRDPKTGCPWDLEQTHESLTKYLIEESFEFIQAVEEKDSKAMEEEIGDVLFQVLLHTRLADERGEFSLESSSKILADKLIRRHPHVFQEGHQRLNKEEIIENWKKIKVQEKGLVKYTINDKLLQAPALQSSFEIGRKSTTVNFDWNGPHEVLEKVEEELLEVKSELRKKQDFNILKVKEEIGDLLFSVAQLARHLNLNPEECLREANKKFIKRFQFVEDEALKERKKLTDYQQSELETFWIKAKYNEENKS